MVKALLCSISYGIVWSRLETKLCSVNVRFYNKKSLQGGHGTGKTGNLAVNFSRQGKHGEFSKFKFLHRENLEFFENFVIKSGNKVMELFSVNMVVCSCSRKLVMLLLNKKEERMAVIGGGGHL